MLVVDAATENRKKRTLDIISKFQVMTSTSTLAGEGVNAVEPYCFTLPLDTWIPIKKTKTTKEWNPNGLYASVLKRWVAICAAKQINVYPWS